MSTHETNSTPPQVGATFVPEHKSVWEKCPFLKLVSKIWDAVCWFFNKIGELFNPSPYDLSKKDLEYLKAAKNRFRPKSPPPSPRTDLRKRNVSVKSPNGVATDASEEKPAAAQSALNDDVYKDFKRAGLNFVTHVVEATYDEMVEPQVPEMQKHLGKLKDYLNFGAGVVISFGSGLKNPLEEKLADFQISETLKPDMQKLMQWLLKDKHTTDQTRFVECLKQRIGQKFDDEARDNAIERCRHWLFETDQSESLTEVNGKPVDKWILESVFKDAIAVLAEDRISQFDDKVKGIVNGNLPDILKRMMLRNGEKIGEIVIERLIEIIDKAPFTETFDSIIALLADQSSAVVDAERARERAIEREKAILKRNDQAFSDSPQNDPAREANRQLLIENRQTYIRASKDLWVTVQGQNAYKNGLKAAKLHLQVLEQQAEKPPELNAIEEQGASKWLKQQASLAEQGAIRAANERVQSVNDGDDETAKAALNEEIKEQWLQSNGELAARHAYKEFLVNGNPLCHPKIDELELVQDEADKAAKSKSEGGLEKVLELVAAMLSNTTEKEPHLFDNSANRLMNILFPPVKVEDAEGRVHEVDGLLYLFDQIEYENEVKQIYEEAVYIYQEVLTDDKQQKIVDLLHSNYATIERIVLQFAKNKTKTAISNGIAALFQKFIVPERVDEMMAYDALPALQGTIVESLAKSILSDGVKTYAPLFRELIEASEADRDGKRDSIIDQLTNSVKSNLRGYANEIEDAKLRELVASQVELVEIILRDFSDTRIAVDGEDLDKVFLSTLKEYFKTQYHGSNSRYGDLVINTAFKLGDLSSTADYFSNWFKGTLSREVTAATHEMQKSPHYLVQRATEQIDHNYSTKEQVRKVLYEKSQELDSNDTNQRLQTELEKTARIAHALIYYNASQQGFIARRAIHWVIGQDHAILNGVITRIYQKMLGNTLYTQNLMVRVQERISEALQQGAKAVAEAQTTIQKVNRVPSLIPSFVEQHV